MDLLYLDLGATPPSLLPQPNDEYITTDISEVVKQLVFSPVKEEELLMSNQLGPRRESMETTTDEQKENQQTNMNTMTEATIKVEQQTITAVGVMEPELAPAVAVAPLSISPVISTVVETEDVPSVDDDHLFPTFAICVQTESLAYVSEEMKTQETLLLSAMQPQLDGKKQNTKDKKRSVSNHSTPSARAKKAGSMSARNISASASKRPNMAQTPKGVKRDAIVHSEKKRPSTAVKRKLTLASSPVLTTRTRSHFATPLSTEEQELERIRAEKNALRKLKLTNAKNLENVLYSTADALPVRSTKTLTQPQEMKFRTESRSHSRAPSQTMAEKEKAKLAERVKKVLAHTGQPTEAKPFSFRTTSRSRSATPSPSPVGRSATPSSSIRSSSTSRSQSRSSSRAGSRAGSPERSSTPMGVTQVKEFTLHTSKRAPAVVAAPVEPVQQAKKMITTGPNGLTHPKPFAMRTDSRVAQEVKPAAQPFVSLASQVTSFLGGGPDRIVQAPITGALGATQLTAPKEFQLSTSARGAGKEKPLTTEERILKEIEQAKLKAEKEKEKLSAATAATVPAPRALESFRPPAATVVQPFHLSGPEVVAKPKLDAAELEKQKVEQEREERKRRLLAAAKQNGVTVAQAPVLSVLQRVPLKEESKPCEPAAPMKPLPVGPPTLTAPAPFKLSTDVRGAAKEDSFKAQLAAEQQAIKQAAAFKAQPMPDAADGPDFVPTVPHRKILADLTPQLRSVQLHQQSSVNFAAQLAAEKLQDQSQRKFVAKAAPSLVLQHPTFVVKPSCKSLTAPTEVHFRSNERAEKRAEFDYEMEAKKSAAESQRQTAEKERAAEEARALKKFRETLVHHAQPVPVVVKPVSSFRAPR